RNKTSFLPRRGHSSKEDSPPRLGERASVMKFPFCLSALLLTASLGAYSSLPPEAWGAAPPASPALQEQSQFSDRGAPAAADTVLIPGPLRSFLRMAAISQKVS